VEMCLPGANFDSIIVGYYQGNDLIYVARVKNGFTPARRESGNESSETETARRSGHIQTVGIGQARHRTLRSHAEDAGLELAELIQSSISFNAFVDILTGQQTRTPRSYFSGGAVQLGFQLL
jgi:hypothetical protein